MGANDRFDDGGESSDSEHIVASRSLARYGRFDLT